MWFFLPFFIMSAWATVTPNDTRPVTSTLLSRHARSEPRGDLAHDGWDLEWNTTEEEYNIDDFQIINKEELLKARQIYIKNVLTYTGITFGSVLLFVIIAFCFLVSPKRCLIAFGTGSPCCLIISPCILKCVEKFLDPGKIVQGQMNKYLPGMVIDEQGKVAETYDPTPEELEALRNVVEEVMEMY